MEAGRPTALDQLATVLARQPMASAADLARSLGVSVPTLHRMLQALGHRIVSGGKARRARYALRRPLRGVLSDLPLYEVDADGQAALVSHLAPVMPEGTMMPLDGTGWPLVDEARDGWWGGLPYPLHDMRPQGYMGRQFARAEHHRFEVPANPVEWSDDDILHVLSRSGSDVSGNLILGDPACERWLQAKVSVPEPIPGRRVGAAYGRLAEQAIAQGVAGSSAAGEFPKFPALRDLDRQATPHVLVKFSGADGSPAVRRWADLLVAEHLALDCAATLPGVQSARSRVAVHAGRTFLEVERFDRVGMFGRSRLVSLDTVNATLIGEGVMDWPRLAARLAGAGWLSAEDELRILHLWWFGRLIANTDMHLGNLSFRPSQGELALAPTYDMLPMLYAPLAGGEVPAREFQPPLPLPAQRAAWTTACAAALAFWTRAAADRRIGGAFRKTCADNALRLNQRAERA
ncbi:type II toxin-antitoxin system HipA family toxin YjjJ [Variovorax saccharolyticus]|uniref:type II toxin-antitoxin system HipA family toxin YjjJ n=1 Tax=Variovorax saccharolyticus TaxID=3053516 RepID=UPI002578705A|nr:type II toxin-antitoxin system HipA family toxin YjjJ [Variovorax sp. J22R187]MDM0021354.1 type II toxin-antitoxin system HipA family toxin YjjJ [Variovorax sp. J22R187]